MVSRACLASASLSMEIRYFGDSGRKPMERTTMKAIETKPGKIIMRGRGEKKLFQKKIF